MTLRAHLRHASLAALLLIASAPVALFARPAEQITNGTPVPDGRYPFIVSLQQPSPKANNAYTEHFCGGSLLDATHVLTAAHCVWTGEKAIPEAGLRVLAGATRLRTRVKREGELLAVERIAVHPKYKGIGPYDVAVLTLKRPAPVSEFVALPAAGDARSDLPGTVATVAGWGNTRRIGGSGGTRTNYPRQLREATVPVARAKRCNAAYHRAGIRNLNLRVALCAGGSHRDSCYGDSGGPLFTGGTTAPVQIGVVSWGIGCGMTGYPGIYSRLSNPAIAEFIQKELRR
jgi:trypsin